MGVSRTGERVGEGTANRKAQDVLYTSDEGRGGDRPAYFVAVATDC